jgi:hypothetical protein
MKPIENLQIGHTRPAWIEAALVAAFFCMPSVAGKTILRQEQASPLPGEDNPNYKSDVGNGKD